LKAMATGLPVLAAADNGRAGPVIDGRNGLTYRWNDPGSLAARIIELTESPPLVSSLSSAGRRTADAHRWTEISRSWFECYRSLRPAAATSTGASRPDRRPRVTVPTTTLPK
jgi:glycosyltransferase involved in cell wall biosynthesis